MIDIEKKEAKVFDFDDTIVKTNAKTHIYRNGIYIKSLTSSQYTKYIKHPDDKLDLSEFDCPKNLINTTKPYIMWNLFTKSINDPNISVYILTARHKKVKKYIYNFLKSKNINLSINNIFTIGDNTGNTNIPLEKRIILEKLCKKYSNVDFYDDNKETIEFMKNIFNLKTYLV